MNHSVKITLNQPAFTKKYFRFNCKVKYFMPELLMHSPFFHIFLKLSSIQRNLDEHDDVIIALLYSN